MNVRAPSPCQPSTMAPASIETIWPSRMRRAPGTPWTISSSIDTHSELRIRRDAAGHANERRDAAAAADHVLGHAVEIGRRDARLELIAHRVKNVRHEPAGDGHLLDLAERS